jgi:hypothetical protein
MQGGLVVGHAKDLFLDASEFRVRKGGRKKVIKDKRKNVHAFVIGNIVSLSSYGKDDVGAGYSYRQVKYNPYKNETFVYADTGEPCLNANIVMMREDRTVWAVDSIGAHEIAV